MFKPWTNTNSLPQGPGYYHLTSDVTLADTWNVPHDETHLCLNGNKIILDQSSDANKAVVNIAQSNEIPHKLVLYDKEDNTGTITHASGQTGSGVQVVDGGDFVMKGGTISGNDAHNYGGGGVFVGEGDQNKSATFDMDGGIIAHNIGSRYGSGVAVDGGTFTMSGGTITQNAARNGGGVADVFNFQISVSGNPMVTGNQASENPGSRPMGKNLCLVWPTDKNRIPITISGALGEDAKIGISTILDNSLSESLGGTREYTDGVFTSGYKAAQSADPWNYFISDNPEHEVLWTHSVPVKDNKELVVPASDVVVSAAFKKKPTPAPTPEPTPTPTPAPKPARASMRTMTWHSCRPTGRRAPTPPW